MTVNNIVLRNKVFFKDTTYEITQHYFIIYN